ncbi:hypothetical protein B0H11DRAFT_2020170 [Mycena galericulata]|nr:hypothetical protein B0H11DRAFT_2020170 [Mycena galericulata]
MALDSLKLIASALKFFIPYSFKLLSQRLRAVYHGWTYEALPTAQNVVVVGGSFAGMLLASRLSRTLPTGYKVIMIEKNSHFNFSWTFPRFAVIPGHEDKNFIPYDGIARAAPAGIWRHVRATATRITDTHRSSTRFLAIATGSSQPVPSKVLSTDARDGCAELRAVQENIQNAGRIAVIGGGPVGIEIASDIKSFFPGKDVTLYHSRSQLLPRFGHRLHEHVAKTFETLGIHIVYQERPEILPGEKSLRTTKGVEDFDLIIPCTGQHPNSTVLNDLAPEAISKETNRILVKSTLQIHDPTLILPHIFALGDVAETGGPKMAMSCFLQAEIVLSNILAMIGKRSPSTMYIPQPGIEGAIKLTLGKTSSVVYAQERDGSELLVPGKGGREDLGVEGAWRWMGVRYKKVD